VNTALHADAMRIARDAIAAVLPEPAVRRALRGFQPGPGRTLLIAVGKAAWRMAHAALEEIGPVDGGIVITKYGHAEGALPGLVCREAGHPIPDENTFRATREALDLVSGLRPEDTVLFLLSGGGSALFELPLIGAEELRDLTEQLLACGADITEINCVRKRLSAVKGGRFARACAPAAVRNVILSDVLGDPVDQIASGPTVPDRSTYAQARAVAEKYGLRLSAQARTLLSRETPKDLPPSGTQIVGSVRLLCQAAADSARSLGYTPVILTDRLCGEAKDAGVRLAAALRSRADAAGSLALIAGGETVVRVTGNGKGGRSQELALAACAGISGMEGAAVFSVGSDGTDGPTDAAGGYVDGDSLSALRALGLEPDAVLRENDAYHALRAIGGLIVTGPTGTNVNDVSVALLKR
jgi:hydroxypyruvate reductase